MTPEQFPDHVMYRVSYFVHVTQHDKGGVADAARSTNAFTQALAAIVSFDQPGAEKDGTGQLLPASALLAILEGSRNPMGPWEAGRVREALAAERHGSAWLDEHRSTLIHLDTYRGLGVLHHGRLVVKLEDVLYRIIKQAEREVEAPDDMD